MAQLCADRLTALLTGLLTAVLTDELAARSGRVCALRQLTATLTANSQDYSQQHSQILVTAL